MAKTSLTLTLQLGFRCTESAETTFTYGFIYDGNSITDGNFFIDGDL